MNTIVRRRFSPAVFILVLAAVGLLGIIYYSPIWWVSLTAPNYPVEAFPDGVRIHFHMNGVFNGCKKVEKKEIRETEALDCVHEMDTINHYVGMYPIAAGGVIERAFSPFLISLLGVMLLGFMIPNAAIRSGVMGLGFLVILGWMSLVYFKAGGLEFHNEGYLAALVNALDQGGGDQTKEEQRALIARLEAELAKSEAKAEEEQSSGQALIARLKAELAKSEAKEQAAKANAKTKTEEEQRILIARLKAELAKKEAKAQSAKAEGKSEKDCEKDCLIDNLRVSFQKDQEHKASGVAWTGSGSQMLGWHYEKSLARYFNNPAEIAPMVAKMTWAAYVVFAGLVLVMLFLLWGTRKTGGLVYWLLILVPIALPAFFILDYAAWLWWYGHNLNGMAAFTVKAFMPTVLGDGKVAQFGTHSYPSIGFGFMLLCSVILTVAAFIRRRELKERALSPLQESGTAATS